MVLVLAWRLGARIGIGTAANAVLVGSFIEGLTADDDVLDAWLDEDEIDASGL